MTKKTTPAPRSTTPAPPSVSVTYEPPGPYVEWCHSESESESIEALKARALARWLAHREADKERDHAE